MLKKILVSLGPRSGTRSDRGVTLMELMVGMTIMTIFMAMFTGAVVMMYNSTSKTEAIGDTASQLSMVFSRLDKSVRYASAITFPNAVSADGNWYVKWQGLASDGTQQCTELQFDTSDHQLKQRTWLITSNPPPSFTPIASNVYVAADASTNPDHWPFRQVTAVGLNYQLLGVYLVAETSGRAGPTTSISDVTFTAFNASLTAPTAGQC